MTAFQPLRGVIAPTLTPFNDDLTIAEDLYLAHARRCLADGCVGLAPFGTTSEAQSVGIEERMEMLEALAAAGIAPSKLIPGTGLTSLPDTLRLTRHAVGLGCAGVLVLPPFYYKDVPDDGLYDYYRRLIDGVGDARLRIYLYHIPQVAGVGLPVALVRRLHADFPNTIVGIKDSSGDWENTAALLAIDGLVVYPGSELPLMAALELGAMGSISATANINAAGIAEVIRLFDSGDRTAAAARHETVRKFRLTVQGYAPIPVMKRMMALASGDRRWANTRPPLLAASVEEGRALAEVLAGEFDFRLAA
ncbi:MAG: dihydrodipicolinate synthase family protein [Proteobacteria bacterium]|nr:dihydrodipicolinate synthase family protein [Pseudomonadota bacterium]